MYMYEREYNENIMSFYRDSQKLLGKGSGEPFLSETADR